MPILSWITGWANVSGWVSVHSHIIIWNLADGSGCFGRYRWAAGQRAGPGCDFFDASGMSTPMRV